MYISTYLISQSQNYKLYDMVLLTLQTDDLAWQSHHRLTQRVGEVGNHLQHQGLASILQVL